MFVQLAHKLGEVFLRSIRVQLVLVAIFITVQIVGGLLEQFGYSSCTGLLNIFKSKLSLLLLFLDYGQPLRATCLFFLFLFWLLQAQRFYWDILSNNLLFFDMRQVKYNSSSRALVRHLLQLFWFWLELFSSGSLLQSQLCKLVETDPSLSAVFRRNEWEHTIVDF